MKKIIIILFIFSSYFLLTKKEETITIPANSIRFRIIANSNTLSDQALKLNIKNELIEEVIPSILKSSNIAASKEQIKSSIPQIKTILDSYNINYDINFGNNYFPTKNYKGTTYQSGNYESLVITLGEGLGNNWWCVLYPPLCLIEEDTTLTEPIYKSYFKEIITNFN